MRKDLKKKLEEKKKRGEKETPQTCKSPTQRKRFITIKNVSEKKKKKKLKSLIGFLSANKIDNYNRGGKKGGKIQKNI